MGLNIPAFSACICSLERLFCPIHYLLFDKCVVLQNGQKIELETGGTLVLSWLSAVRLSPKEIPAAHKQPSTVDHARARCTVQGVQHTPRVLGLLRTPTPTPHSDKRLSPTLDLLDSSEIPCRDDLHVQSHAYTITLTYIRNTKVAGVVPHTTSTYISVQGVSDRKKK